MNATQTEIASYAKYAVEGLTICLKPHHQDYKDIETSIVSIGKKSAIISTTATIASTGEHCSWTAKVPRSELNEWIWRAFTGGLYITHSFTVEYYSIDPATNAFTRLSEVSQVKDVEDAKLRACALRWAYKIVSPHPKNKKPRAK